MKKWIALLICVMMMVPGVAAFAEVAELEPITIEVNFDGSDVAFEDGFSVKVPDAWMEFETEDGVTYGTEDESAGMVILFREGEVTIESMAENIIAEYGAANYVVINGIEWVTFTDTEYDVLVAAAAASDGFYQFTFYPASDEAMTNLATQIMATVKNG
ncbi:hypothetical protein LJC33_01175 [Eubacteriales bacterium OttesenSCG-928-N13]|nr:hypothetical protein [Eubacteriales bacterium OttesenSCG-928-N13]